MATRAEWPFVVPVVEERQRAVGHGELAEVDVAGHLVTELVLQLGAVTALRLGVQLDLHGGVGVAGDDACTVVAQSQRRLGRILRGRTGDLVGAAGRGDGQG